MKHLGLTTAGVLGGIAAATVFLCLGAGTGEASDAPSMAASAAPLQPAAAEANDVIVTHAVFVGEPATFGPRANRHASDALQVAGELRGDALGWQYVQLRL